jgi:hypothetical protein
MFCPVQSSDPKKHISEALLFKSKALLPWLLAMEAGVGAFNDAGIKMEESKCLKQFSTG